MEIQKIRQQLLSLGAFLGIAYASYFLILLSLPYLAGESNVDFLLTKQYIYHIKVWRYSFYIHVFTSPLVIVAGLLQFNRWVLAHWPKVHRISGYIYTITVLFVTGPAACVMSLMANGGYISQISFTTLSILWIAFTFISYRKIRQGEVRAHIIWNLRSYALTLSAITLRIYMYLFMAYGNQTGQQEETYILVSYLSWIPNLLLVELLIRLKYPDFLMKYKQFTSK